MRLKVSSTKFWSFAIFKRKMKTSQQQYDLMLTFMEQYGDLSKPSTNVRGKIMTLQCWAELTSLLNSDSGSGERKTTEKWKKVWSDFKNNTKRKAARLHRAANEGGPAVHVLLSDIEHRVLNVIGIPTGRGLSTNDDATLAQEVQPKQRVSDPTLPQIDPNVSDTSIHEVYIINEESNELKKEFEQSTQNLVMSPSLIRSTPPPGNEENMEDTEDDNQDTPVTNQCQSHVVMQPALSGQTRLRRTGRMKAREKTQQLIRAAQTEQAIQQFLQSDAEWREFKMQQHQDYMELKREQNRIREMEVQTQKEWQTVGLRALDILDKLVTKYCKDSN